MSYRRYRTYSKPTPRNIEVKYAGNCVCCGSPIKAGEIATYYPAGTIAGITEAVEEFVSDTQRELGLDDEPRIQLTNDCPHGWASHDRELEDGTMIFESGQLDGCNGTARDLGPVWVSTCVDPAKKA